MIKRLRSKDYNYNFDDQTGLFARWGKTLDDNPTHSPVGNEILDIEVSTICTGINGVPCSHCYKSSSAIGENMSLTTYRQILDKMPATLCQVALGIGNLNANPDLKDIILYTRSKHIVPNITINGAMLTDDMAQFLVAQCGAISVSRYEPKDVCYDAVKRLTDLGLKQCNIHMCISRETLPQCYDLIDDYAKDPRLSKLNAIVFMMLKPKGNRNCSTIVSMDEYRKLISHAVMHKVPIGGDSCQAGAMYQVFKELGKEDMAKLYIEDCESFGLFSSYINVRGDYYPCSFAEGEADWQTGLSVLECNDFVKDIWFNPKLNAYRDKSLANLDCNGCRKCLIFDAVNIVDGGK